MYNFQNIFNNSFIGYYINDYSEVLNHAIPADGSPVLFANLDEGLLWSKKYMNGIPFIQPYKIEPISNNTPPAQSSLENKLDNLINILIKKEGLYESSGYDEHATQSIKNEESSGV